MNNGKASALVWAAAGLLVVALYYIYPWIAARVAYFPAYCGGVVLLALAIWAWRSGKTPRQIMRAISFRSYLYSIGLVACAVGWVWLTFGLLGIGRGSFSAFFVAVPTLVFLVSAINIAFVAFYQDVGLGAKKKNKRQGRKEAAASQ